MALHCCSYDGKPRVLLAVDSNFPPNFPIWTVLNFLSLTDEKGIPDPRKAYGKHQNEPYLILLGLLVSVFRSKDVKPPKTDWDFSRPNNIRPNPNGGPFAFIRDPPETEHEVDRQLFLLCDLLGVKIGHGWIQSPDPKVGAKAERGLTEYGLDYFTNEIDEDTLALMFRDGGINIVRKHNGTLYQLEADKSTLDKLPIVVWRMATVEKRHEIFFEDMFTPLELTYQPNAKVPAVAGYIQRHKELQEKLLNDAVNLVEPKAEQTSPKKKTGDKRSDAQDHGRTSGNKKSATAQPAGKKKKKGTAKDAETPSTAKPQEVPSTAQAAEAPSAAHVVDDEYEWVKEKFKDFLEKFIDPHDDAPIPMPFYVRLVEGWKGLKDARNRPYSARIHFPHIQHHDRNLALAILNGCRRLHNILAQVFLDFRVNQNCGSKEELKGKVKVRIICMPPAGSTCQFEDFIKSNNTQLAESYKLWDNTFLNTPAYIGRRAGKGYVDDLLENHRAGKSWNGKISKKDLGIKDGRFLILTSPTEDANGDSMCADFLMLTQILFEMYKTEASDAAPLYFDTFQAEILKIPKFDIKSHKFRVFQRYLSHHLAFKAPLIRAGLFIDIWGVIQSLRKIYPNGKREEFLRWQNRCSVAPFYRFYHSFKSGWFFENVYWHDNTRVIDKYGDCLYLNLLELICHLEMHLHDHTRNCKGEQLLQDTLVVDLMIAQTFADLASALVYEMMLELDDEPFSKAWEKYKMFECGDDLHLKNTVSEGGKGEEVESGGKDSASSESREGKPENFAMLEPPERHGDDLGLHAQNASMMLNPKDPA